MVLMMKVRQHRVGNLPEEKKLNSVKNENTDVSDSVVEVARKYMHECSLHGLKYITEKDRHISERIFWTIWAVISWILAIFLIYKVIEKWNRSPILVSFDSDSVAIYQIPFPSITICNMNKVRKSRVEHIEDELASDPNSNYYQTERRFVDEICAKHEKFEAGHGAGSHTQGDLELTGEALHEYLADLGVSCADMLLRCHFEGHTFNCTELFQPIITDEGLCCTFNTMPESIMFRRGVGMTEGDEDEETRWANWTMQDGYKQPPNLDSLHSTREMPLRAIAPGLHMGLSVLLDVQEEEYYCSGTESVGFKGLLHTPITLPEMIEYGFAIHPGTEAFYAVSPSVIHADEVIHHYGYEKRNCYLDDERHLTYFNNYTFLNCYMECSSNFTFSECGCVAYYMPRDPSDMPICAPEKSKCVDDAITTVEESAFDGSHETNQECRCLPSCTDMEFPHETSVSQLSKLSLLELSTETLEKIPSDGADEYVSKNLAVIHVYFKSLHFMQNERGELYGFTDFFSNVGGLLGLCLGFSALSLIEFIYFFTLRLILNIRLPRRDSL